MRSASCRLLALAAIVGCAFLTVPAAQAEVSNMSVQVQGSATLVAGVYLAVPVTITCLADQAFFQDELSVSVTQKAGKAIAHGSGGFYYQSPDYNGIGVGVPVTCDGLPHAYMANVFPDIPENGAAIPFKGGKAVVSASFSITEFSWQSVLRRCWTDHDPGSRRRQLGSLKP